MTNTANLELPLVVAQFELQYFRRLANNVELGVFAGRADGDRPRRLDLEAHLLGGFQTDAGAEQVARVHEGGAVEL